MLFNYVMLLTVLITIFVKAVSNMYSWKWKLTPDLKKKLKYDQLDKLFQVFMIGVPAVGMALVPKLDGWQILIFVMSYSLIYFCVMDWFFNWLTGKNIQYIGQTSIIDITLRRWFKIGENKAKNKNLVTWLKWLSFIIGLILMIDFIKLLNYFK